MITPSLFQKRSPSYLSISNCDRRKKRYEIPRSPFHKITLKHDRRKRRYEIPRSLLHKIILNRDRRKNVTKDRDRFFTKRAKPRSPKKTLRKTAIAFSQNHQTAIAEKDVMKYRDRFFTKRAKPRSRNKYVTKDRDRFCTKLS